ncbi:MAG: KH domain-containing protein, partial [Bacilli bacterium]|nr:KH domain-containing protein [Bacilli bacterium]
MIKVHEYLEKNIDVAKEKMLYELETSEKDILIKESEETTGGLFKSKKSKIEVILKDDIIEYSKQLIIDIAEKMGLEIKIEAKKRDDFIKLNLISNNNAILIGKNGKTLDSLQTILRSSIQNHTGFKVNIIIDIEDYREKQQRNIE